MRIFLARNALLQIFHGNEHILLEMIRLGIVREVEHLVAFSKQNNWMPNKLPRSNEMDGKYKNPDNDGCPLDK